MKKNFVKYFGVTSATLLAAAPAVTPALMTASNLQVVKADGVQSGISAAFKADNTVVPISDADWRTLTKNTVKLDKNLAELVVPQKILDAIYSNALSAREQAAQVIANRVKRYIAADSTGVTSENIWKVVIGASAAARGTDAGGEYRIPTAWIGTESSYDDNAVVSDTKVDEWAKNFNQDSTDKKLLDAGEKYMEVTDVIPGDTALLHPATDVDSIANSVKSYIKSRPLWWFVNIDQELPDAITGAIVPPVNGKYKALDWTTPNANIMKDFNKFNNMFNGKYEYGVKGLAKGYVTVAPKGGTKEITDPSDPSLRYVGDNITDLQRHTGDELLNLVPAGNHGSNPAGVAYARTKGQFVKDGLTYVAEKNVREGSDVWDVILRAVLNSDSNRKTLSDITTGIADNVKMLVNGKDATQSQFVTADEIKNADKISIQFVITVKGTEYKTPTVFLSHGQRYSVDTSRLGNIVRRPGDFYGPNFNLTGTDNETGLPLDPNRFVVVPAGTPLSAYSVENKTNDRDRATYINLSALSGLMTGIQNSAAIDFGNHDTVSSPALMLKPDDKAQRQDGIFFNSPALHYSKYGTYSDAVDIYYIDKPTSDNDFEGIGQIDDLKYSSRAKAADIVESEFNKFILDKFATDPSGVISGDEVLEHMFNAIKPYVNAGSVSSVGDLGDQIVGKSGATHIRDLFASSSSSRQMNKDYVTNKNAYPLSLVPTTEYTGTLSKVVRSVVLDLSADYFINRDVDAHTTYVVKASELHKVASNAGRTTKVDVPSKYLPQVSFDKYNGKKTEFYGDGSVINNWYEYSVESNAPKDAYYPNGGITITDSGTTNESGSSRILAPGAFKVNQLTADQLKSTVTDVIQNSMSSKLSNPNTESISEVDGYYKGYTYTNKAGKNIKADAANAYIANGHVPGDDIKVDVSAVDLTKPGTYYVNVTYTPLNSINKNANGDQTNKFVRVVDANGNLFMNGHPTEDKFIDYNGSGAATSSDPILTPDNNSTNFSKFDADQIFANGAPSTFKLAVEITDGTSTGVSGSPVIAFTEGGENLTIPKGGTFDLYKNIQFYAYPGAKAWDQKDSSLKVEISGSVNTNVEGKYTLVYKVTNSAGKTSTLTRVVTVGSGVEAPTEYDFNMSPAYIDYVPGYNVREFSSPRAEWGGQQLKHGTSVSVTKKAVFQDGETWYKLGDGNWVKAEYVQSGSLPSGDGSTPVNGVVDINYVPGYGIAVYKAAGTGELVTENGAVKRLPHATSWKAFKKQTVNGITYYNLGGDQWVDGRYVNFH